LLFTTQAHFSFLLQFTQILDILQAVLNNNKIKYLILTGSTPVDIRQTLVDEFTEDETIPVFLLSTKAGGKLHFAVMVYGP
jgi:SWI/SNF-related matrix-associated actin-dependent regulator 1 of chromatin subfamily A